MAAASSFWIYLKNWISWAENFIIGFPFYWLGFPAKRKNSFAKKFCLLAKNGKFFFFCAKFRFILFRVKIRNFREIINVKILRKNAISLPKRMRTFREKNGIFYKNAKLCAYTYVCYRWILPPLKMGFPE